jgi:hypothetical protein
LAPAKSGDRVSGRCVGLQAGKCRPSTSQSEKILTDYAKCNSCPILAVAEILGKENHADLLEQTLDEEKHADEVLTGISDTANTKADKAA